MESNALEKICLNSDFTNPVNKNQILTRGSQELFLKAVSIWINKPHVANRRLCGAKINKVIRCFSFAELEENISSQNSPLDNSSCKKESILDTPFSDLSEEKSKYTLIYSQLVPKSEHFKNFSQAIIFDSTAIKVIFIPLKDEVNLEGNGKALKVTHELPYILEYGKQENDDIAAPNSNCVITLKWANDSQENDVQRQMSAEWLAGTLLPKLAGWAQVEELSVAATSLTLVPVDKYQLTYQRLKHQYGKDLVENWTESTDPKKFVYEDVAIAAYLLLIWEEDREMKNLTKKQSFVDLGCGNGLLVYILTMEGHPGLGIDLRKRKIWDTFGPSIKLQESSVTPSANSLFPAFDWIIGNHSDELTPWIPVIAARSSYDCCFFLLPCCPHDFVGRFSQRKRGLSQYACYMDYVKEVIKECGFLPQTDTLRIPSTKRTCFIGRQRSYQKIYEVQADQDIKNFIKMRTDKISSLAKCQNRTITTDTDSSHEGHLQDSTSLKRNHSESERDADNFSKKAFLDTKTETENHSTSNANNCDLGNKQKPSSQWAEEFKPRVEIQPRNCQKISQTTKDEIVGMVFSRVMGAPDASTVQLDHGSTWRRGGSVGLGTLAAELSPTSLKQLKAECGGLQTLLRNHGHIFQVTGGLVRLRDFSLDNPWEGRNPRKGKAEMRVKGRLCWFHAHHPDGCPRPATKCTFAHGDEDLVTHS